MALTDLVHFYCCFTEVQNLRNSNPLGSLQKYFVPRMTKAAFAENSDNNCSVLVLFLHNVILIFVTFSCSLCLLFVLIFVSFSFSSSSSFWSYFYTFFYISNTILMRSLYNFSATFILFLADT